MSVILSTSDFDTLVTEVTTALNSKADGIGDLSIFKVLSDIVSLPCLHVDSTTGKRSIGEIPFKLITQVAEAQAALANAASVKAEAAADNADEKGNDLVSYISQFVEAVANCTDTIDEAKAAIASIVSYIQQSITATQQAQTATSAAETAAQNANDKASLCETATAKADEVISHPGYIGSDYHVYKWNSDTSSYDKTDTVLKPEGFNIFKVYTSLALMEADVANVEEGKFVIINTGSVNDVDTAKLYVRGVTDFEYLVDLSGMIGADGKIPQISIGTVTEGNAAASLEENGTDQDGNPMFKLNLVVPKGNTGVGIQSVEKTSTNGLIDTYTITFDDESTKTYTVTNGADLEFNWLGTQLGVRVKGTTTYTYVDLIGEKGNTGVGIQSIALTSTDGLEDTYTITFTDATTTTFVVKNGSVWTIGEDLYWYKDGVKTENYSQGPKGNTGKSGVQVSSEEPTDPDVNVWIKPNETADLSLKDYSNEINVDKIYPLASGYYTLVTSIASLVDESLRKTGVKITFQSAAGIFETWQFKSVIANWSNVSYWEKLYTNTPAQLFAAVALTNPYPSVTPREIGDIAINSTTKEIWTAIATNASVDSWELSSQGTYGGTLITDVYSITKNGFYSITSTGQHVPTSDESFYILALCSNLSTTSAVLTVIGLTSGKMYMIRKVNSVWGNYIGGVTQTELSYMIGVTSNVQTQLNNLQLGDGKYYIGGWNPDDLSPVPTTRLGDQTWSRNLSGIYLFDMTLNTGDVMYPVGELNRANWLRFTDGSFAPTIGITEEMRATCDVDLYLDNAQTTLYSAAGAFDAASFYNTYGMSQKLYDGSGNEVRILRPWETVETKYHIGFAFREKVWLIDGLGDSGKYWQGLSQHDTWDGMKGVPLEKTAFSPGPATSVGNKMRNFFFVYNTGDSYTVSGTGKNGLCTLFSGLNRQFPRVSDVNQITNMNYARANNPTTTNPYPVAEGGYHTLNSIISRAEVLYNTRYLHNPSLFGSGISSNDTCNSEATFLANGGFKYKKSADSTYSYCTFGVTPTMYYTSFGSTTNASDWLNGQYPKEQCLESQMAASFAKETGISQNTDFTFYGNTYQYRNVTGVLGLADGYMNVIVTKVLSQTISAFDNSGTATNYDISCCLRMSVIDGVNLLGDIFEYVGGGYEQVGTNISTVNAHHGDTIDLYIQPDQRKWHNDSTVSKNDLGVFDFEKAYTKAGTFVTAGDNYSKKRNPLTPFKVLNGGNMATGMCYYQYENNYWSAIINQRVRIASRFRGTAFYGYCSARCLAATADVSLAPVYYGGPAQILMS